MNKKYLSMSKEIKKKIFNENTGAEYGSLKFLFSESGDISQSALIKAGRRYEEWFGEIIKDHIKSTGGSILPHGVLPNLLKDGKNKDVDLLYDGGNGTIYYRELKGNIELDTEKLLATAEKVKVVTKRLQEMHIDKVVEGTVLCWGIFDFEKDLKKIKGKVRSFKNYGVDVIFPKQLFDSIGFSCTKQEYIKYFR